LIQQFVAHGIVLDSVPYQIEMTPKFKPFRRNVEFSSSVRRVEIKKIFDELEFLRAVGPKRWGMVFRRGLVEITEKDYEVIIRHMGMRQ
jgi:hypothetical protein